MVDLGTPILFLLLGALSLANTLGVTERWPRTRGLLLILYVGLAACWLARVFFEVPVVWVAAPRGSSYAIMLLALAMLGASLVLTTRKPRTNPQ